MSGCLVVGGDQEAEVEIEDMKNGVEVNGETENNVATVEQDKHGGSNAGRGLFDSCFNQI